MKLSNAKTFLICLIGSLLLSILLCLLGGCMTRKVDNEKNEIKRNEKTEQASDVHKVISDSTNSKTNTLTNESYASESTKEKQITVPADSVRRTEETDPATGRTTKTTTIYTGGKSISISGSSVTKTTGQKFSEATETLQQHHSEITDSADIKKQELKTDSLSQSHKVDAKGSGSTWPWVAGVLAALCVIFWFVYVKK